MLNFVPYKKLVARLVILIYLLIGAGMGNALFLCQEADASSHVEYTLAGMCQDECLVEADSVGRRSGVQDRLLSVATDCFDAPVSLTHLSARAEKLMGDSVVVPLIVAFPQVSRSYSGSDLGLLNQVLQPPPMQALAVLRTTVLLH